MDEFEFILYVADQIKSKNFYEQVLQIKAVLDVPGMTEFKLSEHIKLGLMPEKSIAKILKEKTEHPAKGNGIPRCELYFKVPKPEKYIKRGLEAGAKEVSKLQERNWGDNVGYLSDPDGHIIAFAEIR